MKRKKRIVVGVPSAFFIIGGNELNGKHQQRQESNHLNIEN
jgi:hypothetical protein